MAKTNEEYWIDSKYHRNEEFQKLVHEEKKTIILKRINKVLESGEPIEAAHAQYSYLKRDYEGGSQEAAIKTAELLILHGSENGTQVS